MMEREKLGNAKNFNKCDYLAGLFYFSLELEIYNEININRKFKIKKRFEF